MLNIEKIHEAIDAFVMKGEAEEYDVRIPARDNKPRKYLGLSGLGDSCIRKVWYQWRQCYTSKFPSRMLRLFRRGDVEEYRFIYLLRGIGFTVHVADSEGKQFKVSDFEEHLSGHMDGVGSAPKKFWKAGSKPRPFLLEFKSYNDKRFQDLCKRSVEKADPKYYTQIQSYMGYEGIDGCLFCAVNKNDDELEFQWIPFKQRAFANAVGTAEEIIHSQSPPKKLSDIPSYYECRYCDARDLCHGTAASLKACRSCKHAVPAAKGAWECQKGGVYGEVCKFYQDIARQ